LLRALLLQSLYTVRSERLLMEEIDYSVLFSLVYWIGDGGPDLVAHPLLVRHPRLKARASMRRVG